METVFFHGFRLAGVLVVLKRYPPSPTVWLWLCPPGRGVVLVDFWDARSARLWAFGGCPLAERVFDRGAMQDFRAEFVMALARVE